MRRSGQRNTLRRQLVKYAVFRITEKRNTDKRNHADEINGRSQRETTAMLNVKIVTIGGLRESYLREAAAEYEKRCRPYCKLSVIELKSETALAGALEDKNYKIALCVEGKELSSPELSALIEKNASTPENALKPDETGVKMNIFIKAALKNHMHYNNFLVAITPDGKFYANYTYCETEPVLKEYKAIIRKSKIKKSTKDEAEDNPVTEETISETKSKPVTFTDKKERIKFQRTAMGKNVLFNAAGLLFLIISQ